MGIEEMALWIKAHAMLLNPLNPCKARPTHASVREVERRVPGRDATVNKETLPQTKWKAWTNTQSWPLMNVHTHIHGHSIHTNVMHTYIQKCFKYCPFLLPLLILYYTVLAQLDVTSYFLEFSTKRMSL